MRNDAQLGGVLTLIAFTGLSAAETSAPGAAPHPIFAPAPSPPTTTTPPALATVPLSAAPSRAISPAIAARLAAIAQRYVVATERSGANATALNSEPPPSGTIRLSPFLVAEKKERPLDERKILTAKGEEAIAMQRYITETDRALNFFTLPLFGIPKEARAVMMLREQQRLDDMARFKDLAELTRLTSPADAAKLKQATDAVFMREPESGR